jgi:protein-disulfide isomerase
MKILANLAVSSALLLPACAKSPSASAPPPGASAGSSDSAVAELKGARITAAELDKEIKGQLLQLRQQEYDLRRQALDNLLGQMLLKREATARGVSTEELLKVEIGQRLAEPSEAQIADFYAKVRGQVGGKPLEAVRPQLVNFLRERAGQARMAEFRRELMAKQGVKLLLKPPRFDVKLAADAPAIGPEQAPVTIVEYTDFQCPYCRRGQETVDEVLERYKGKVRLVHRDYPLENHPRARPAALASYCAGEQGRFWEYRRSLLLEGGELGDEDLRKSAQSLKLDAAAFQSCIAARRHEDRIQQALIEGQNLGVASTPTFLINGRMLLGARSIEDFAAVIDEELARSGPRS